MASPAAALAVLDWIEIVLRILLTIGLAAGAGLFFWRFYAAVSTGDELKIEYHWGGLGGGLGGWRISKSLGFLFAAFALGGLLAVAVVGTRTGTPPANQDDQSTGEKASGQKAADAKTPDPKAADEQKAQDQKQLDQKAGGNPAKQ